MHFHLRQGRFLCNNPDEADLLLSNMVLGHLAVAFPHCCFEQEVGLSCTIKKYYIAHKKPKAEKNQKTGRLGKTSLWSCGQPLPVFTILMVQRSDSAVSHVQEQPKQKWSGRTSNAKINCGINFCGLEPQARCVILSWQMCTANGYSYTALQSCWSGLQFMKADSSFYLISIIILLQNKRSSTELLKWTAT